MKSPISNHSLAYARAKTSNSQSGIVIIYEIVIIFIFSMVMMGVISFALYQIKLINSITRRESAFQIAEAGSNYYQWHLAHFPTDYQDGTGAIGPYVHDYVDKDTQQVIGQFSLNVIPPTNGSTIVTIESTAHTLADPAQTRKVTSRYGIPSLARYAFLTNSDAWIGDTENISGEFHTNGGVRFDGTGNAPITSSKQTYTCVPTFGCSPAVTKNGIWGAAPQATQNLWQFPVPNIDFSSMTSDLAKIKSCAQSGVYLGVPCQTGSPLGIYLPPSNVQGYSLVFNANNTVSIYTVTSLTAHATGWDVNGVAHNEDIDYNARTKQDGNPGLAGVQDFPMPPNGLIYIEDRTWVQGTVASKALVAAARLPYNAATAPSIIVPNNLIYTIKDGTVALGLIAQKDVLISFGAPATLEIDAALIAQNGSAQRFYFPGNIKTTITIYGATLSFGVWTWSWVNGAGTIVSGYQNTNSVYDSNLLFSPPPYFPLDPSGYQQITWSSN